MKILISSLLAIAFFVSGCTSKPYAVAMPETDIDTSENTFVFLTKSRGNLRLSYELKLQGFKVKKKFRGTKLVKKTATTETHRIIYDETRYGIELDHHIIDLCMVNSELKVDLMATITDLKTNEEIFVLRNSDWTGSCGITGGNVYKDMAVNIRKTWDSYRK